jgi:hypothetical protein
MGLQTHKDFEYLRIARLYVRVAVANRPVDNIALALWPASDKALYVNFVVLFVRITSSAELLCWQGLGRMRGALPEKGTFTAPCPASGECALLPGRYGGIAPAT